MNNFKVEETFIKDLLIINSKIFKDGRKFFQEFRIKEKSNSFQKR